MTEPTDRLISRISLVASAATVIVLCATAAVVSWPRVANALGVKPSTPAPAYRAGDAIDVPADWYQSSPFTLVVFARASCGACLQARPFLQQLVRDVKDRSGVLLASGGEERTEDLRYARGLGLDESSYKVTPAGLRVRATPTLVLVDRSGRILAAWEGVGPVAQQAEISKAIGAALKAGN